MKYRHFILIFLILVMPESINGQTTFYKTFSGSNSDIGISVYQDSLGSILISGFSNFPGTGLSDLYLIKTNNNGDTIWTRIFGGIRIPVVQFLSQEVVLI
jgi:hypothetical protein